MRWLLASMVLVVGCAARADVPPEPAAKASHGAIVEGHCGDAPRGPRVKLRHKRNRVAAKLGDPRHRGVDLIAMEGDEIQTLGGKLAYTAADKDLQDEDVEVFACLGDRWWRIARARTDDEGRFEIGLAGAARLPVGMRDLYLRAADGTGVRFLAYVAPRGTSVIVTDVDGTITASEKAVFDTVLRGRDIGHQPDAPRALAASGQVVVYLTARGDQYTEVTRRWLRLHGFPRGPVRLAESVIVVPGERTARYKAAQLRGIPVPIAAGIGNRASDIAAYARLGLPPARIFIKRVEFADELREDLAAGRATPFEHYRELPALLQRALAAPP